MTEIDTQKTEQDFHALVHQAQEGDVSAISQLLRVCQADLTQMARGRCETSQDVEDALQETMWIISTHIGKLRVIDAFWGWTKRIIIRECSKLRDRTLAIFAGKPADSLHAEQDVMRSEPSQRDEQELLIDISNGLEKLSADARRVIIEADVLGHSTIEIADKLNISVEASKSRLRRARHSLKLVLQS